MHNMHVTFMFLGGGCVYDLIKGEGKLLTWDVVLLPLMELLHYVWGLWRDFTTVVYTGNVEKYNVYVRFGNEMEKSLDHLENVSNLRKPYKSRPSSNTHADSKNAALYNIAVTARTTWWTWHGEHDKWGGLGEKTHKMIMNLGHWELYLHFLNIYNREAVEWKKKLEWCTFRKTFLLELSLHFW